MSTWTARCDDPSDFCCTWDDECPREDAVALQSTRRDHYNGDALCPEHLPLIDQYEPSWWDPEDE